MTKKIQKLLKNLILVVGVFTIAIPFSLFSSLAPSGVVKADTPTLDNSVIAYQYYKNLFVDNTCGLKDDVSGQDIGLYNYYNVYGDHYFYVGLIANSKSGNYNCADYGSSTKTFTIAAANALGLNSSNPGELLCQLGYTQTTASSSATRTSCANSSTKTGTDSFHLSNASTNVRKHLLSTVLKGNEPTWTDAMAYWSTLQDFFKGCAVKQATSNSYGATVANIKVVDSSGNISSQGYTYDNSDPLTSGAPFAAYGDINNPSNGGYTPGQECTNLATALSSGPSKYINAYQTYVVQQACSAQYSDSSQASACVKGAQNKTNINYCGSAYAGTANKDARLACYAGQGNQGADACIAIFNYNPSNGLYACIKGSQNASDPNYCNAQYPAPDSINISTGKVGQDTNKVARDACLNGQQHPAGGGLTVVTPNAPSSDPGSDNKSSCPVDGIGWIVCPLLNAVGGLNDAMWKLVSGMLTVSPLQQKQSDGTDSPAYSVWKTLWSLANVGYVIVFLFIIFRLLTGGNVVGAAGARRMLSRFFVCALLSALSFLLIQLAVDLSNVIGNSLYDFIGAATPDKVGLPTWSDAGGIIGSMVVGTGATVAIIGAVAIAPGAAFMIALPAALAALLGFLAALITLIFRQAIIPILAVLAPVAILAYVFDNTKPWFNKWKSLFMSMLMLFPLAGLLFGGVKLAAYMLNSTGQTLIALVVMGLPLFSLPFLARQAGPMLSKIQGGLKSMGGKIQKPVNSWADKRKANSLARSDASTASRWNLGKRMRQGLIASGHRRDLRTSAYNAQSTAKFNRELAHNADQWAGSVSGADAQAYIRGAGAKAEAEELKAAVIPLEQEIAAVRAGRHSAFGVGNTNVDDFLAQRATDTTRSATEQEAAMHKAAALGRDKVVRNLSAHPGIDQEALQRAVAANAGSLVGKAPDLVKGPDAAFGTTTGDQMAGYSSGSAEVHMKHLENLHNERMRLGTAAAAPGATAADVDAALRAQQKYQEAIGSFNSAVDDIQKTPALQSKFGGDVGKEYLQRAAALPAAIQGDLTGLSKIQSSDGKIR